MGLNVNIDEQAHVLCALNADQSNYVDFVGGGNLLLNYDPTNGGCYCVVGIPSMTVR